MSFSPETEAKNSGDALRDTEYKEFSFVWDLELIMDTHIIECMRY